MTAYPLIGQARLMEMMFHGDDLAETAALLIETANAEADNAEALLDLSTIFLLRGDRELGLSLQLQALAIKQQFRLQAGQGLRLLVLKTPGDFMANSPVEFLIRNPQIDADVLYVAPDLPYPTSICHDLVYNGISEGHQRKAALKMAGTLMKQWGKPFINRAEEVALLSRDRACEILDALPGTYMPQNLLISREEVSAIAATSHQLGQFLVQDQFPILLRPVDSHAGQGLQKLHSQQDIKTYLETQSASAFYVAPFVDYRSKDGLFRKYRISFIKGQPFLCHMALSERWMIHYLNAGMSESADKRDAEALAMQQFNQAFGDRHQAALQAVADAFDLEYFSIDCAETQDQQLLIFEVGNAMVVHDMDPVDLYPYKKPHMHRLFEAFQALLLSKAHAPAAQRFFSESGSEQITQPIEL